MGKRLKYFWLFETLTNQHWTTNFSFFHPSLSQISICLSRSLQFLIWHMTSCPRGSFSHSSSCYKHSEFRRLMKAFTKKKIINEMKFSYHAHKNKQVFSLCIWPKTVLRTRTALLNIQSSVPVHIILCFISFQKHQRQ